jgi:RNA polymerase subunit RPABC4/transcription elongation factor Spt4
LSTLTIPDDMKHLINYDEKVIWVVSGSETVVVSDQRIIMRKTAGLGLKKTFVDYPYSNMVNIILDRGVRHASVEILMRSGVQNIKIANMSKSDAFQLHRILRENIIRASSSDGPKPFPVFIQSHEQTVDRTQEDVGLSCKKCGHRVSDDFTVCPFCRYALKIECPECGKTVDRKFKLCPYCGEDLSYLEQIDLEL